MTFFTRKPVAHVIAMMGMLAIGSLSSQVQAVLPTPSDQPVQFPKYNPNLQTTPVQPTFNQAMPASATSTQSAQGAQDATDSQITPANNIQEATHGISKQVSVSVLQEGQLVPVTATSQLNSGDVIEYQVHFTNNNPDRVRSMMVTLSIPEEVDLVGNVAPQYAFGSSDGYRFSYMPLRAQLNGQVQELPFSYYKALRWQIENLGLGETTTVTYQAKIK